MFRLRWSTRPCPSLDSESWTSVFSPFSSNGARAKVFSSTYKVPPWKISLLPRLSFVSQPSQLEFHSFSFFLLFTSPKMQFQKSLTAFLAYAVVVIAAPQGYEDCECTEPHTQTTTTSVLSSSTWAPPPSPTPSSTWTSSHSAPTAGSGSGECQAGAALCCQTVTTPGNATGTYGGLIGGILSELTDGLVGLGCTDIPLLGGEWYVSFASRQMST